MGEYKEPEWYDDHYRQHKKPSELLTALHETCARKIIEAAPALVLDYGCGPGWFEQTLYRCGFDCFYEGCDTSGVAIKEARRNRARSSSLFLHGRTFATRLAPACPHHLFTFLEVLEHLEDDRLVFGHVVPRGAQVLLTVPTFDSTSHVRWFKETDDLAARYGLTDATQWVQGPHILCMGKKG